MTGEAAPRPSRWGVSKPATCAHFGNKAGFFTRVREAACTRLLIGEAERFLELGRKRDASGPQADHAKVTAFLRRRAA